MERNIPLIDDPLAWQDRIDSAPAPINTYGSVRFWRTVKARGLPVIYRNGEPDFNEIVFDLGDGIGLELSTDAQTDFIRYRFVEIVDDDAEPPSDEEKEIDDAVTAELSVKLGFDVSDPEQLKRFWQHMIRK